MTNQNCPFCGCEVVDYTEMCIQHPINKCCLSTEVHLKEKWNSRPPHPLEKKVEEFKNKMSSYSQRWTRADVVLKIFNKIFGEKE